MPLGFVLLGVLHFAHFGTTIGLDQWVLINSIRSIANGIGYTGQAATQWPPLYSLLAGSLTPFLRARTAGVIVSLISAAGVLCTLPLISRKLFNRYGPGLLVQTLLGFNPWYFKQASAVETHMLDAFLFLVSVFYALDYLKNRPRQTLPLKFILVSALACLTRYTSLVLVVAMGSILIWSDYQSRKETVSNWITANFLGTYLLIFSPWLLYNYLLNNSLPGSGYWAVIGWSLSENEYFEFSHLIWGMLERFNYSGAVDILTAHFPLYLHNIVFNSWKILTFLVYDHSALGYFSWVAGVGLIGAILATRQPEFTFLILTFLFTFLLTIVTRVGEIYFIHFFPLFAILGVHWLLNFSPEFLSISGKWSHLPIQFAVLLIVIGVTTQTNQWNRNVKRLWKGESTASNRRVLKQLRRLRSTEFKDPSTVRVMTFKYPYEVYQAGFQTVIAPIPDSSSRELLCYSQMEKERLDYFLRLNYPHNKPKQFFVPPDFLIVDRSFNHVLQNRQSNFLRNLKHYLIPVHYWQNRSLLRLYRVKTRALSC